MSLKEFFTTYWGHFLLGLMTLVQISPIQIKPWTWIGNLVGKFINASVSSQLDEIKSHQQEIQRKQDATAERLDEHIVDDERRAIDAKRRAILNYNNELCRDVRHTKEAWVDILSDIDVYVAYCKSHPEYPNSRAEAAIKNIKTTYQHRLNDGDFLAPRSKRKKWFD